MDRSVKVKLNGHEVYGYPGQKILDLCAECGIEIPTLCYEPHLSVHGGCSVCLVEVKNAKSLIRACSTDIREGMEIYTDTERATNARKLALELFLSDHVGDCRPPCTLTCPAQGDVQAYVNLAAAGKYRESLDVLHEHVTLPACIGRVCPAPCEEKCRRNFVDEEAVSIREIKRFVADYAINNNHIGDIPAIKPNGKSVGVVGGGPAGISAAYYLKLLGYDVTIYEKEALLGGMMRYGIPDYRLPQEVLQKEIDWLLDHGIDVRTNTALGVDVTLDELRENHEAVLLAMGCWQSSSMRAEGEDLDGVLGGIDFLYEVNKGNHPELGNNVAVIGGGNTAMDACRCAKRLGAENVSVIYRRTRDEMPAEDLEIEEAMEEGIEFTFLASPKAVVGNGKVEKIICEKMELGEPDSSGRRKPVPTGETFEMPVDNVIAAIGQKIDFKGLPEELHDKKRMYVDNDYATPLSGVFVCGDQQTGPKIAIEAIGNGHWAAESIHHYLETGKPEKPFAYDVTRDDLGPEDFLDIEKQPREQLKDVPAKERLSKPFEEYIEGLTEEQVLKDASRCMECACPDIFECKLRKYGIDYKVDPDRIAGEHISKTEEANEFYIRNMDKCILCGRCVRACDEIAGFHAIDFSQRGFKSVMSPEFYEPVESSDCTFCGLCTQVCPVGALLEKRATRWPHTESPEIVKTTCNKCPVGCELELNLDSSGQRIVRITSDLDSLTSPSHGHCCVKGRYHFHDVSDNRLELPVVEGKATDWESSLEALAAVLRKSDQKETAVLTSASLFDQDYRALDKFFTEYSWKPATGITDIDTFAPARQVLENRIGATSKRSIYDCLNSSDVFFVLQTRIHNEQPVLLSWIRRSMRKNGSKLVFIGQEPEMLARGENAIVFTPPEGSERDVTKGIYTAILIREDQNIPEELVKHTPEKVSALTGIDKDMFFRAADAILQSTKMATLFGAEAASSPEMTNSAADIMEFTDKKDYFLLYREANAMGAVSSSIASGSFMDIMSDIKSGAKKTVILVDINMAGIGLTRDDIDNIEDLVVLSTSMPDTGLPENAIVLPVASWAEKTGTVTSLDNVELEMKAGPAVKGSAKELSWILSATARRLGLEISSNNLSYQK
jgi:formate dehydrogenase major subunit